MNEERSVKLLLWIVVSIWGLNVVMIKFLVGHFPPVTLAAVRIGAATLLVLGLLRWKGGGLRNVPFASWISIGGAGIFSVFFHHILLGMGLQTADASTGAVILGLNPLITGILAFFLFSEPLTRKRITGVILGFCGVILVVMGDSLLDGITAFHFGKGEFLIVLAMFVYVIGNLFVKKAAEKVHVLLVTAYMNVIGTLFLGVTAIFEAKSLGGINWPTESFVWAVLLFSGWVATGICGYWWNHGISKIGAGRTAMYINGLPAASLIFAVILLGERFNWVQVAGFATVFFGIYLGTLSSKKKAVPSIQPSIPQKEGCA